MKAAKFLFIPDIFKYLSPVLLHYDPPKVSKLFKLA